MSLHCGAVDESNVSDCGIFWSYLRAFRRTLSSYYVIHFFFSTLITFRNGEEVGRVKDELALF